MFLWLLIPFGIVLLLIISILVHLIYEYKPDKCKEPYCTLPLHFHGPHSDGENSWYYAD